jgi:hypothetical protein
MNYYELKENRRTLIRLSEAFGLELFFRQFIEAIEQKLYLLDKHEELVITKNDLR